MITEPPYEIDETTEPFFSEEEFGDRVGPEFEVEDEPINKPAEEIEF